MSAELDINVGVPASIGMVTTVLAPGAREGSEETPGVDDD